MLIMTHLSCEEWPPLSVSVVSPRPRPLSSSSPPPSPFAGPLSASLAAAHPASPAGGGAKTPQGRGYLLSLPPLAVPSEQFCRKSFAAVQLSSSSSVPSLSLETGTGHEAAVPEGRRRTVMTTSEHTHKLIAPMRRCVNTDLSSTVISSKIARGTYLRTLHIVYIHTDVHVHNLRLRQYILYMSPDIVILEQWCVARVNSPQELCTVS